MTKITEMWLKGPQQFEDGHEWFKQTDIVQTNEGAKEQVKEKPVIMVATENKFMNNQSKTFQYKKLLHIIAWVKRFIYNCRQTHNRIGPLSTIEIESSERSLITSVSTVSQFTPPKRDEYQIWSCAGFIPNYNPTFIPKEMLFARLIIGHYDKLCIYRRVSSTMCKIVEGFWIPQLRRLVQKHIWKCGLCKRY